jgi:ABC-type transport system involved in multi-copper enzyme maturation permease subunit
MRGFVPIARREIHRWFRTRRGLIQLFLWSGLLGGVLALALFVLPNTMTEEGPLSLAEILEMGRQLFFGIGAIGLSIGTIILLQDAFIEDRAMGTAELVLSKPLSRTAYVLGRLVPNLLGFLITMLVIPGLIGYLLFLVADPSLVLRDYLSGLLIIAVQVLFYATLSTMLGVVMNSRGPYLAIALGSLIGGAVVPVEVIVQFTPWRLSDLAIMSATGLPLPESGTIMLTSTLIWIAVFVVVAITRMNRAEL